MTTERPNLPAILEQLSFELLTRSDRFTRLGETEAEDPELADLASFDREQTSEDPYVATIERVVDVMGKSTSMNNRMFLEVGKSIGFDLRILNDLALVLADLSHEVAMLRLEVDRMKGS